MEIIVNDNLCRGCGVCIGACPYNAISLHEDKVIIDQTKCNFCQACIELCPTGALRLSKGEEITVLSEQNPIAVLQESEPQNLTQQKSNWGVVALTLFGQHVLPKMMDLVAGYLEQKSASTSERRDAYSDAKSFNDSNRRRRQRRGRMIS